MSGRSVSPVLAVGLAYRLLLRQLVTRGRVAALLVVGLAVAAVAWAVGASDEVSDPLDASVGVIAGLGFTVVVPVVSLVFATAALGDPREDGTLVYLWLRPIDRWPVVVGAWLASLTLSLPLTLGPLALAAVLSGQASTILGATMVAAIVGVIAYSALFLLLGLAVKNPIVWGLGYVLIWEGIISTFGSSAARLAISGYTRSIVTAMTDVDVDLGDQSLAVGIIVPSLVALVALFVAARRLDAMDIA